jgi:beta-galactosidase
VTLHVAEPREDAKAGDRVFSIRIQGQSAWTDLDIVKEAGGAQRAIARTFKGVAVTDTLVIALQPKAGQPLLCGIEARME